MEDSKRHQVTLPRGGIRFSSLDLVGRDDLKYQVRSPHELTSAIISTDERHNDCFLLHSAVPAASSHEFLQIIDGEKFDSPITHFNWTLHIGRCSNEKGFADFLPERVPGLRSNCRETKLFTELFWDPRRNAISTTL